MASLLCGRKSQ